MTPKSTIVVKIGTNILTTPNGSLDLNNLRELSYQIAKEKSRFNFIIVTSGAITCGSEILGIQPLDIPEKQAAAAIGQSHLMKEYSSFFGHKGITVAQILLTKEGMMLEHQKKHITNTIQTLLKKECLPIINENDSVVTDEIKFGDNDELSALLACLVNADQLIVLTDIDGYFTKNPKLHPDATLIEQVEAVTDDMIRNAEGPATIRSRGGIKSKLVAAQVSTQHGILTTIANGRREFVISDVLNGKPVGTRFEKARKST